MGRKLGVGLVNKEDFHFFFLTVKKGTRRIEQIDGMKYLKYTLYERTRLNQETYCYKGAVLLNQRWN